MNTLLLFSLADFSVEGGIYWWIAQIIGFIGTAFNLSSFQFKTRKSIVTMMLISCTIFSIHFFLLSQWTGALLNLIAAFRAVVFSYRGSSKWADHVAWVVVFIGLALTTYVLNFTVPVMRDSLFIGGIKPTDYIIELLPVIGIIITTFSMRAIKPFNIRLLTLINSPMWLIYNAVNGSIPGAITETFSIISIVLGIIRLDILGKKTQEEALKEVEIKEASVNEELSIKN